MRFLLALILCLFMSPLLACERGQVDLRGPWGQASFDVDLADTAAARSRGLMFVRQMPARKGMLFVYPQPQPASFWMRNTYIPLDMLFIDETGVVRHIARNARPLDETPISGGDGILLVLEVNGGTAQQLGITVGSQLRHPDVPQDRAVWACD